MTTTTETLDFTPEDLRDILDRAKEGIALKAKTSPRHKDGCVEQAHLICSCGAWEAATNYVEFAEEHFPSVAQAYIELVERVKELEMAALVPPQCPKCNHPMQDSTATHGQEDVR